MIVLRQGPGVRQYAGSCAFQSFSTSVLCSLSGHGTPWARLGVAPFLYEGERRSEERPHCQKSVRNDCRKKSGVGKDTHIPPNLVVRSFRRALIPSRGQDLQVEHPVGCGYASALYFHPTETRMQGAPLIRNQVVQMRQPREKGRLTPTGVMEALHRIFPPHFGERRTIPGSYLLLA